MLQIRVLIRNTPAILRDILVRAIATERDMELVRESGAASLMDGVAPPDVVIDGSDEADGDGGAHALLERWPATQILMITDRGQHVFRYELLPQRTDLGDVSPDQLVEAIRSAVRPKRPPYRH